MSHVTKIAFGWSLPPACPAVSRAEMRSVMIRLFTDTSANLPLSLVQQHGITVVPFSYTVDGVPATYDINNSFNGKEFYDAMRAGAQIKTSMINSTAFIEAFSPALEAGDDVLYVGMSGGISGTAGAAALAAEELSERFPERHIAAIDTLAASMGEGLQVLEAAAMIEAGVSLQEVEKKILQGRQQMSQFFTVDDLEYLHRGGRITGAVALVGTVLNIKPLLRGNEEGQIVSCGKVRGFNRALQRLADYYEELVLDKSAPISIAHADNEEACALLLEELKRQGLTGECVTVCYEPVTGSHVGPGTVALFFRGAHK